MAEGFWTNSKPQAWIESAGFDLCLILGPPIFSCVIVFLLKPQLSSHATVGPWLWLTLIVGVDVAHVYASVFRTYLDPRPATSAGLWLVPLICWVVGAVLYSMQALYFWRALAYLAVFHFVRQQYGFSMLYARDEKGNSKWFRAIDKLSIYAATLYPLFFWHTHQPRNFNWFVEGDFFSFSGGTIDKLGLGLYVLILATYLGKELWITWRNKFFNIPRNLIFVSTALSWFVGIVLFNNDLVFTFTNVVSHGIPYMALVWLYGRKSAKGSSAKAWWQYIFRIDRVPLYFGVLLAAAYVEEGLWGGLIWREHLRFFPILSELPWVEDKIILTLLIPLLALPQSTHYVFDAMIWKVRGPGSAWKDTLFKKKASV